MAIDVDMNASRMTGSLVGGQCRAARASPGRCGEYTSRRRPAQPNCARPRARRGGLPCRGRGYPGRRPPGAAGRQTGPVTVNAAMVDAASARLAGVVSTTPLERNSRLSEALGARVWLEREDLQTVR